MTVIALCLVFTSWGAALVTFALKFASAEKRAAEANGRSQVLDVNLTSLAAQLADVTTKCREEKERGDRLDDAHAQLLAEMATLPATGAYARLLAALSAAKAASGDGPRAVPAPEAAKPRGPDDLLDPSLDA